MSVSPLIALLSFNEIANLTPYLVDFACARVTSHRGNYVDNRQQPHLTPYGIVSKRT